MPKTTCAQYVNDMQMDQGHLSTELGSDLMYLVFKISEGGEVLKMAEVNIIFERNFFYRDCFNPNSYTMKHLTN